VTVRDPRPALRVDLCSDTVTRPTGPMRAALRDAVVGDEQRREDPTVRELEERVAVLLGKPAGVFMPSGTMCNIVALFVLCRAGDEVIMADTSHPVYAENAGPAVHSRVSLQLLRTPRGIFSAADVHAAIRPDGPQRQRSRVVAVENTNTLAGGTIWPIDRLDEVVSQARAARLSSHLDGARLLNAVVSTGIPASRYARGFDSAWIDLSKGLGCPMGAVLTGSEAFVAEARRAKHLFGGALRQAGVVAAAGLYALEHHVERLADDHLRARTLAERARQLPGISVADGTPETNIVHLKLAGGARSAEDIAARCLRAGVRFGLIDARTLRAVTHLDVDDAAIDAAVAVLGTAL
jgi:threonine aldolase